MRHSHQSETPLGSPRAALLDRSRGSGLLSCRSIYAIPAYPASPALDRSPRLPVPADKTGCFYARGRPPTSADAVPVGERATTPVNAKACGEPWRPAPNGRKVIKPGQTVWSTGETDRCGIPYAGG